jgi:aspartyl protease family protein
MPISTGWHVGFATLAVSLATQVNAQTSGTFDSDGLLNDQNVRIAIGLIFLLFVGGSAVGLYRGRLGQGARDLVVWIGLGTILVAGYGFRDEFRQIGHRMLGDLMPPGEAQSISQSQTRSTEGNDKAVRIRKRSDGHFVAKTEVNGVTVTMLVDTGASSVVQAGRCTAGRNRCGSAHIFRSGTDRQRHGVCRSCAAEASIGWRHLRR